MEPAKAMVETSQPKVPAATGRGRLVALLLLGASLLATSELVKTVSHVPHRSRQPSEKRMDEFYKEKLDDLWSPRVAQQVIEEAARGQGSRLHDPDGTTESWLQEQARAGAELRVSFFPLYFTRGGAVGYFDVEARSSDGYRRRSVSDGYVSRSPAHLWTELPAEAFAGVTTARIQSVTALDLSRAWMRSLITMGVEPGGNQSVVFDFMNVRDTRWVRSPLGFQEQPRDLGVFLDEVTRDGEDCGSLADFERLALTRTCSDEQSHRPEEGVRWTVRYHGTPADSYNRIRHGVAELRQWIPVPVGTSPPLDITLITPSSSSVLGLGPPATTSVQRGWRTDVWHLAAGAPAPAVTVVPGSLEREHLQIAGVAVSLYGDREHKLRDYLRQGLPALAQLGLPLPPTLDAVLGSADYAAWRSITVADDDVFAHLPGLARWWVTTLVAEQWFGIEVARGFGESAAVTDALAGYLAMTAQPPAVRALVRYYLAKAEATAPARAILSPSTRHRRAGHGLGSRAIRILAALEARIGAARMLAIVRRLHARLPSGGLTWQGLVAAVATGAGEEDARWLLQWLKVGTLPALEVTAERSGDTWSIAVASAAPAEFGMTVPLVFYTGDAEVARTEVVVSRAGAAPARVVVPAGADRAAVDPGCQTLIHFEGDQDRFPVAPAVTFARSEPRGAGDAGTRSGVGSSTSRSAPGGAP